MLQLVPGMAKSTGDTAGGGAVLVPFVVVLGGDVAGVEGASAVGVFGGVSDFQDAAVARDRLLLRFLGSGNVGGLRGGLRLRRAGERYAG